MPALVYFDTDVFHRMGETFAKCGLSTELRDRILLSPITIIEALSHLTLKNNADVLAHIQAIHNWINPKKAGLLPWPDVVIARIGFGIDLKPDGFIDRVEKTINQCLATGSADEFRESADKLKNAIDKVKDTAARSFQQLIEMNRKDPLVGQKFSEVWVSGTAQRVKADTAKKPIADVVAALSAYHEFEESRLKEATSNAQYKPDPNDILDSEQLVYIGDPALRFLTCDGGYLNRVKKSPQAALINRAPIPELSSATSVETLLKKITD